MHPPLLPTINATLNASAGFFLILGGIAIKNKDRVEAPDVDDLCFYLFSLFLCAYLYYHLTSRGISHYQGKGILKTYLFYCLDPAYDLGGLDRAFYHHGHTPCFKRGI